MPGKIDRNFFLIEVEVWVAHDRETGNLRYLQAGVRVGVSAGKPRRNPARSQSKTSGWVLLRIPTGSKSRSSGAPDVSFFWNLS